MRKWWMIAFWLLIGVAVIQAQNGACGLIVEKALDSVDEICNGMDRNTACYGATLVDRTTVQQPSPVGFFSNPGDRADLIQLTEIRPQALNEETQEFGVGLLNVQANVPNTVPGQAVLFLLMGDARLTNETPINAVDQTAFQSFYFLPGVGESDCYEAEPMLTIQTPGNVSTTIYLNGVETEFSPGTLLTITPSVCTIHRGNIIRKDADGNRSATLLSNESVDIFIDEAGAINVTNKRAISEREYERGEAVQSVLNSIAFVNDWQAQFLRPPDSYGVEPATPPSAADLVSSDSSSSNTATTTSQPTGECDETVTVKSGETLHMIAERYDTSVLGIAAANNLDNPRVIYPGQVLCIPDVGSGFEALPAGYK